MRAAALRVPDGHLGSRTEHPIVLPGKLLQSTAFRSGVHQYLPGADAVLGLARGLARAVDLEDRGLAWLLHPQDGARLDRARRPV